MIEASDFTIRVQNLPPDKAYGDNEHVLRAKLWEHFQVLAAFGDDDKTAEEMRAMNQEHKFCDQDHCKNAEVFGKYEITDICFGRQEISETTMYMQLHPYYKDVITYEAKLKCSKDDTETENVLKYLNIYNEVFDTQMKAARK